MVYTTYFNDKIEGTTDRPDHLTGWGGERNWKIPQSSRLQLPDVSLHELAMSQVWRLLTRFVRPPSSRHYAAARGLAEDPAARQTAGRAWAGAVGAELQPGGHKGQVGIELRRRAPEGKRARRRARGAQGGRWAPVASAPVPASLASGWLSRVCAATLASGEELAWGRAVHAACQQAADCLACGEFRLVEVGAVLGRLDNVAQGPEQTAVWAVERTRRKKWGEKSIKNSSGKRCWTDHSTNRFGLKCDVAPEFLSS